MRQLFLLFSGVGGLAGVVIRIRMVYSDEQKLIGEESDYYRSAPANKASPELGYASHAYPLETKEACDKFSQSDKAVSVRYNQIVEYCIELLQKGE